LSNYLVDSAAVESTGPVPTALNSNTGASHCPIGGVLDKAHMKPHAESRRTLTAVNYVQCSKQEILSGGTLT